MHRGDAAAATRTVRGDGGGGRRYAVDGRFANARDRDAAKRRRVAAADPISATEPLNRVGGDDWRREATAPPTHLRRRRGGAANRS